MEEKSDEMVDICQCCMSTKDLKSMTEPFIVGNQIEIYYDMVTKCFTANLMKEKADDNCNLFICDYCIEKLRSCWYFRRQVEKVQEKLKDPKIQLNYHVLSNGVKEEDLSNNEFYNVDDEATNQKREKLTTFHITQINTKRKNINNLTGDRQMTTVEKKVKNSLAKIKPSQLNDNLIYEEYIEDAKLTDPLQATENPQETTDSVIDNKKSVEIEILHRKIIDLVNIHISDLYSITNKSRALLQPKPKKKREILSAEEYKRRCRLYLKKRRQALKPYQLNETDKNCNVCGEEFNSHQSLVAHMNEHYPQFICDKCGKGFAVQSALRAHIRIHEEGIPCEFCNKKIMKRNLSKHINAHLGKKDVHRCPVCGERFEKFSSRALHMEKEHNIVKRYTCKWCNKVFKFAGNLNLHIRDQHNAFVRMHVRSQSLLRKPREACHECEVCGKTFRQKLHLKHHHISKHSNEKNFQCDICHRSYYLKYTLNQHMKDYHLEMSKFPCHICNKVFKVKRMVTRHIKKVHNKQSNIENQTEEKETNVEIVSQINLSVDPQE